MRIFLPLSLLVFLAGPARSEDPPKSASQPDCEALARDRRPEDPAAAALWDGCQPHAAGGQASTSEDSGGAEQAAKRAEVAEAALLQARTRTAGLTNPFTERAPAGTVAAGGEGAGADGYSSAPPAWVHTLGAGGSARLDSRPVPPLDRIDQAFADVAPPVGPGPALLAANAALGGVVPSWPVDWAALIGGRMIGNPPRFPAAPMNFTAPVAAPQAPTKRAAPAESYSSPSYGAAITGTSTKNIAAAVPTINFKAGVTRSFIAALGASSWIQGITMSVTPGRRDKGLDHSTLVRVDLGEGRVNGFIETGYEERHYSGRTPQGKSVSGMNTGIPVRVGATFSLHPDEH